eukprot:scaffold56885_cov31-Attheya_sp.AAC.1
MLGTYAILSKSTARPNFNDLAHDRDEPSVVPLNNTLQGNTFDIQDHGNFLDTKLSLQERQRDYNMDAAAVAAAPAAAARVCDSCEMSGLPITRTSVGGL